MKVRDVIKIIEQDGWYLARIRGSHRQYKHSSKSGLVTLMSAGDSFWAKVAEQYNPKRGTTVP